MQTKMLLGNFFNIISDPGFSDGLPVYEYAITPLPSALPPKAREALNSSIAGVLRYFLRPTPGKVLSPIQLATAAHFDLGSGVWATLVPVTRLVFTPGSPEFIGIVRALIRRLTDARPHQRVGRLFFDSARREEERMQV